MAITRHTNDSEYVRSLITQATLKVIHEGIRMRQGDFVREWIVGARAKLKRQDDGITSAILSSEGRPGDYDLTDHAGRVKYCVLALDEIEKELGKSLVMSLGKMAFVDTELRLMEYTYNSIVC